MEMEYNFITGFIFPFPPNKKTQLHKINTKMKALGQLILCVLQTCQL